MFALWLLSILLPIQIGAIHLMPYKKGNLTMCAGTSLLLSVTQDKEFKQRHAASMRNCSFVEGNLELVFFDEADDLTFLDTIEEVYGYVLIALGTRIKRISLPNLKVIWGKKPLDTRKQVWNVPKGPTSLLIYSMTDLEVLSMPKLRAISHGMVTILDSPKLCHLQTNVDWKQVLGRGTEPRLPHLRCGRPDAVNKSSCAKDCYTHRCWGPESEDCQTVMSQNCPSHCNDNSGCFQDDQGTARCCHATCFTGCNGPTANDCELCAAAKNGQECVHVCPALHKAMNGKYQRDPDGRYDFYGQCQKDCEDPYVIIGSNICSRECPAGTSAFLDEDNPRKCETCPNPDCADECKLEKKMLFTEDIEALANCTIINGDLNIHGHLWTMEKEIRNGKVIPTKKLTRKILKDSLASVEIITGYVFISNSRPLRSLDFLENLKRIKGRTKYGNRFSLIIAHNPKLQYFGLRNLQSIDNGDVSIQRNPVLQQLRNTPMMKLPNFLKKGSVIIQEQKEEENACHPACDPDGGCWGPGPDLCYNCTNYKLEDARICAMTCPDGYFPDEDYRLCKKCHSQCSTCTGPTAAVCQSCRNHRDQNICVEECPRNKYAANADLRNETQCLPCSTTCWKGQTSSESMCTGPGNHQGKGGCALCEYGVVQNSGRRRTVRCLESFDDNFSCANHSDLQNYYLAPVIGIYKQYSRYIKQGVCLRCESVCARCIHKGASRANAGCQCRVNYMEHLDRCVLHDCTSDTFFLHENKTDEDYGICRKCHDQCDGCVGPNSTDCLNCLHFRHAITDEYGSTKINCTKTCPEGLFEQADNTCGHADPATRLQLMKTAIGSTVAVMFVLLLCIGLVAIKYRRKIAEKSELELEMDGFDPRNANPDAKPNLTVLSLIQEDDLEMEDRQIGSGAFGTVYRGFLLTVQPKRAVAIKILKDKSSDAQNALLEEGRQMASLRHRFLIPFLGVCVGRPMMIITALMPLGNLLDYIQDSRNRSKIGSQALLRWFLQIAEGMSYLEENHVVHRDLAARNVLVHSHIHIRISDFGLAKILDFGQEEYVAWNDRVAYKWLALECIRQRIFTHKSDVWAYGVTLWEILTFGESPYKGKPLQEIPYILEKGERLAQPKICTLDVYMVLIKCWMLDAESRPSFKELLDIFSKMCHDPPRYLHIEGDRFVRLPSHTETPGQEQCMFEEDTVDPMEYFLSSPQTSAEAFSPQPQSPTRFKYPATVTAQRHESVVSQRYAKEPFPSHTAKVSEAMEPLLPSMDHDNYLIPNAHDSSAQSKTSSTLSKEAEHKLYYNKISDADGPPRKSSMPATLKPKVVENLEYLEDADSLMRSFREESETSL